MAKKMPSASIINIQGCVSYQHNKGTIRENALLALLSDKLFHQRIEKKRKGKESYQRNTKHKGKRFENPIIRFLVTEV